MGVRVKKAEFRENVGAFPRVKAIMKCLMKREVHKEGFDCGQTASSLCDVTWFTRENMANSLPENEVNLCDREI